MKELLEENKIALGAAIGLVFGVIIGNVWVGIVLGSALGYLLDKKNPIKRKVGDNGISLGKEILDKSKPMQSKLKKIISELEFNKSTIIKTALLIMIFEWLIYPPYKNVMGGFSVGHHIIFSGYSSDYLFGVDYLTLFFEYIIIGLLSAGLIYIKSSPNKNNSK